MGSERLPRKVLLDIAGQTMLARVVRRLQSARLVDEVVVAIPVSPANDGIAAECDKLGVRTVRGSEDDVLSRYVDAARASDADVVVRVSADSPFVDPEVCDLVIDAFLNADPPVEYASNKLAPSFPLGLDVEAFSREALDRAAGEAGAAFERSHVTVYMYQNPDRFSLLPVKSSSDRHTWRWTVDTPEDLKFARTVFERFGGRNDFSWREVVSLIEAEPDIAEINSHIEAKPISEG